MGALRKLRRKGHRSEYAVEPLRGTEASPYRKMSEVLLDFAKPLLDIIGEEEFENVIGFAGLCWNVSFSPENEQMREILSIINKLGKPKSFEHLPLEDYAKMLLNRKKEFFANDNRILVDYKIVEDGGKERLLVVSAPAKE
jgi:hypothetical protein